MKFNQIRYTSRIAIGTYAVLLLAFCWACSWGYCQFDHNRLVLEGIKSLSRHDPDRAELCFTDALSKVPGDAHSYFFRALALAQKQKFEQALSDLDAAMKHGEPQSRVVPLRDSLVAQIREGRVQ